MLRYAITDRRLFRGDEGEQRRQLLEQAARLQVAGVEFLQVREKDLAGVALLELAEAIRQVVPRGASPRLLLNGPAEVAVQAGMDGVHLPGGWTEGGVKAAKQQLAAAGVMEPVVSVTTHTLAEVRMAAGATLILFGPVKEKRVRGEWVAAGTGFAPLAAAVEAADGVPVLALGGVGVEDWSACQEAGAAGLAGIRLFLEGVAGGRDGAGMAAG